ncbi:hypothetical protein H4Q26_011891 [Puccinia striiformis f. sp. tritici PST-130]|nr:hypothetical protein H4Q26_011891 [Puccinia striiformis f. sp. tritici PST-130]
MSRIGIRVLIGQHIALNKLEPHPEYVGVICTNTNVYQICREAIDNALFICEEHYGLFKGPPVQLVCPKDLAFMYVPSHLNHMVFEVLKNSLRAVVETHGVDADEFPPSRFQSSYGWIWLWVVNRSSICPVLGGNLKLISMEGYGTEPDHYWLFDLPHSVYLHLSRLSTTTEPLQ